MAYRIAHLGLVNWRNFKTVNMDFGKRAFVVGANAAGKSNLLDSIRFLQDVATSGLQKAVEKRDGLSMIRSLWARKPPSVQIRIVVHDSEGKEPRFEYDLSIKQTPQKRVFVEHEIVTKDGEIILERPNADDKKDQLLLSQTHLEQISKNEHFRQVLEFFSSVLYLHLVPQIIKDKMYSTSGPEIDPYGSNFLSLLAHTRKNTRDARLRKISNAIRLVVPPLNDLSYETDVEGKPHLCARYKNWRDTTAKHYESHLSDGTIRIIGLLWAILNARGPLLLEEPELSLHSGVVRRLPPLLSKMQEQTGAQVIVSTHSSDLLFDKGISPDEVFLLKPEANKPTDVIRASNVDSIMRLMGSGVSAAEAVLPYTAPKQLDLFQEALTQ